jgi:hypothetical protein
MAFACGGWCLLPGLRASIDAMGEPESQGRKNPMKRLFITSIISLVVGLILGLVAGSRMPPSRDQVASYLSHLSVGEYSDFFKRLTAQWGGVPGFLQQPVSGMPAAPANPGKQLSSSSQAALKQLSSSSQAALKIESADRAALHPSRP